ncbi:hypothetical protein ET495_12245 [Xylanimonas allomyrinae]|uniref:Uncharacterized protein n=1 Tax=Xylanimonas allomyrinae TaxID=2509459 RepID=A0A4P6ETZ1_9MICO|nr:hypothetical protein [Xylanimonas allomyrinae]QAY63877.1 hypothetical protein ET495_12245 [Xylanimonas allomyrinae]
MRATPEPTDAALDEDAPPPGTPPRRWALATLLAAPAVAAYGALVAVVGRGLFLDDAQAAALHEKIPEIGPTTLLWILAATAALPGTTVVAREVLEGRAARRDGREPDRTATERARAWPVVWAGSPVAAIACAAVIAGLTQVFAGGEHGQAAATFAVLAGSWLTLFVAIGWILLVVRTPDEESAPSLEGVEETWMRDAATRAFCETFAVGGAGTLVLAVLGDPVDASLALAGLLVFAQGDFAVRLWLLRRREERA